MNPVHFSSRTDDWETPSDLFAALEREFGGFDIDVCARPSNAKCARYFTPEEDGLKQEWTGVVWCNPPYGREIGRWVEKAYESAKNGATCVMLVPSRTDTGWWHRFVTRAAEVRFLKGRLRFGGGEHPAPFPSAIVVFRPHPDAGAASRWAVYGRAASEPAAEEQPGPGKASE